MDNNLGLNLISFKELDKKTKIDKLIELNKTLLTLKGSLSQYIYLIDSNEEFHIIPIENNKFINDRSYKEIFRKIIKNTITDLEYKKIIITDLFYFIDGYFNLNKKNLNNLNLDIEFNKNNANESIIIYKENKVSMSLDIYDKISVIDEGKTFVVLSEKVKKTLKYNKFDVDDNLKGILTNLIR